MKIVLITLCLAVVALAQDKYSSANDDIDISEVLNNERLLVSYSRCLLKKGPCTPEIKSVRDRLPETLATRCAKCTDKQKEMGKTLVQALKKSHPEIWEQLIAFYDPDGKHRAAFEDFLKP